MSLKKKIDFDFDFDFDYLYISTFLANSLGEVCSHVAAILFKIQTAVMLGSTKRSSTSEACRWNKTFRENVGQFRSLLHFYE